MRILIAHSFYRLLGGENRYVDQQVSLLSHSQHDVELLVRRNEDLDPGPAIAARMTYSRRGMHSVEAAVGRFRPDVIHLHNAYPSLGPAVHLVARKHHIPLVMTVHNFRLRCPNGYMFTEGKPCKRCESGFYAHSTLHRCFPDRRQAMAYAFALSIHRHWLRLEDDVDLFIAPSNFMGDRLVQWGISRSRITVVPNFTSLVGGSGPPGAYGMYLGRLSSEKGIELLLRALKRLHDPAFRVVGAGPLLEPARELASELGLSNTSFEGILEPEQVRAALRTARFLVVPSLCEENAPLSALEALAAARPLLVSDRGGLPELVQRGGGLTFESGDLEDLADKMRRLYEEKRLWRTLSKQAASVARLRFSPETHLRRLVRAYEKAVGAGSALREAQPQT